jgi:hypothetical protein
MGILGELGALLGNQQQQQELQGFVQRYQQGAPSEGYTDQEVANRYQQIAPQLPPNLYQQAAQQSFGRMSPQERNQFGQMVQQQAMQQGINLPGQYNYGDPNALAQMATQVHQQQPGLLGQLLGGAASMAGLGGQGGAPGGGGGGIGGMLGNPVARAALAGITSMAVSHIMGGGMGNQGNQGGPGGLPGGIVL